MDKTKTVENGPDLGVVQLVLVKYNLVSNQYQQNSGIVLNAILPQINLMIIFSMLKQII